MPFVDGALILIAGVEHELPEVTQVVPGARPTLRLAVCASVKRMLSALQPSVGGAHVAGPGQAFCAVAVTVTDPDWPTRSVRLLVLVDAVMNGTPEVPVPPVDGVPLLSKVAAIEVSDAGEGVPVSIAMQEPGMLCAPAQPL